MSVIEYSRILVFAGADAADTGSAAHGAVMSRHTARHIEVRRAMILFMCFVLICPSMVD